MFITACPEMDGLFCFLAPAPSQDENATIFAISSALGGKSAFLFPRLNNLK
jgi:hypothetical protein